LEVIPKTIAENSGLKIQDFMAKLRAAHNKGEKNAGIDIVELSVGDSVKLGVLDVAHVKEWAMKLAVEVCVTLLRVDQICMSKPATGPAPRSAQARDQD
jgi:T-complex protein 1 subunit theta